MLQVADGPTPFQKHDTVAKRLQSQTSKVVEFMRSSPSSNSRNSIHFQRSNRVLPVFAYQVVFTAVQSFQPQFFPVQITSDFVASLDRSRPAFRFIAREADFETASLAMTFGGIVLSQDSDYFILCAQGRTCGYAPLDEMSFVLRKDSGSTGQDPDDGFQATSSKKKRGGASTPAAAAVADALPYPPNEINTIGSVRLTVFSGTALAAQLGIPANLLTLLATLMGNDHVNYSTLFFRNNLSNIDSNARLYHLARVIKECYTRFNNQIKTRQAASSVPSSGTVTPAMSGAATPLASPGTPARSVFKRGLTHDALVSELLDPAKALVGRIVERLLEMSQVDWVPSTEKADMVDDLLSAMSTYTTSAQDNMLNQQERELDRFLKGHFEGLIEQQNDEPHFEMSPARRQTLDTYRNMYLKGNLSASLLGIMLFRRLWSFSLLEDGKSFLHRRFLKLNISFTLAVSQASVSATYGQPVRLWLYAVLFSAFGLEWAQTEEDDKRDEAARLERQRKRQEREEWLEEVISVHSESSGSDQESFSEHRVSFAQEEDEVQARKPDPVVVELLRRGDRASEAIIQIPSLSQLLAETELPTSLPPDCGFSEDQKIAIFLQAHQSFTPAIAALDPPLQITVAILRHVVRILAERTSSRTLWWKEHEVKGAILMVLLLQNMQESAPMTSLGRTAPTMPQNPAIHGAAVFQSAVETACMLRQALLLDTPLPHCLFEGPLWHALTPSTAHHGTAMAAVDEGLFNHLFELVSESGFVYSGPSREDRKARKKMVKQEETTPLPAAIARSRFELLDVSA